MRFSNVSSTTRALLRLPNALGVTSRNTVSVLRAKQLLPSYNQCRFPHSLTKSAPVGSPLAILAQSRVADILALQKTERSKFTISQDLSIENALAHLVDKRIAACLTIDSQGSISGLFTARDILKFIYRQSTGQGAANGKSVHALLSPPISNITTKKEKLIYCSPNDTVRKCREIMFQMHIRRLPVIENEELLGVVSMNDLADSYFSLKELGGKKGFMHNITGRLGLPEGTSVSSKDNVVEPQTVLAMDVASFALPHPYKHSQGVAHDRRQYGAHELSNDLSMCEDAHFAIRVPGLDHDEQVYLCAADGVGSWRQYGIDPRKFSHKLVENARKVTHNTLPPTRTLSQYPTSPSLSVHIPPLNEPPSKHIPSLTQHTHSLTQHTHSPLNTPTLLSTHPLSSQYTHSPLNTLNLLSTHPLSSQHTHSPLNTPTLLPTHPISSQHTHSLLSTHPLSSQHTHSPLNTLIITGH